MTGTGDAAPADASSDWGPAARLTLLFGADARWGHGPLHHEIVRRARDVGLAGASVWRGMEGYGSSSRIHTAGLLDLAEQLPITVMIVDDAPALRRFVQENAELFGAVTVTLSAVERFSPGAVR